MTEVPLEVGVAAIIVLLVLKEVFSFLKSVLGKDETSKLEKIFTKMFVLLEQIISRLDRNEKDHARIMDQITKDHARCEAHKLRIEDKCERKIMTPGGL